MSSFGSFLNHLQPPGCAQCAQCIAAASFPKMCIVVQMSTNCRSNMGYLEVEVSSLLSFVEDDIKNYLSVCHYERIKL